MSTDKTLVDVQPGGRVRLGDQLPPLPCTHYNAYGDGSEPLYTAEQMQDYARAALSAQPSPGGQGLITVDDLAQVIRQVDGNHSLGAGALAEEIIDKLPRLAARQPGGQEARRCAEHCQNGRADVCLASQHNGVICPDDSCDIDDGFRHNPIASSNTAATVPQGCDACHRTGIRRNDEGRNVFCPDCDLGAAYAGDVAKPSTVVQGASLVDIAKTVGAYLYGQQVDTYYDFSEKQLEQFVEAALAARQPVGEPVEVTDAMVEAAADAIIGDGYPFELSLEHARAAIKAALEARTSAKPRSERA
ncbi:hypothetical protein [Stenotrophomonas sp. ATs4]|uniref:hypothetical protein n=1 Tax=Stenotrophomonas sp. ATs4 TaxID=3402766 RepID=UPI003F714990